MGLVSCRRLEEFQEAVPDVGSKTLDDVVWKKKKRGKKERESRKMVAGGVVLMKKKGSR